MTRELRNKLLALSIVLTEFLKIAGARIGEATARLRLTLLKERGMRTLDLNEEMALSAGNLLLKHQQIPIANALIASPVELGKPTTSSRTTSTTRSSASQPNGG